MKGTETVNLGTRALVSRSKASWTSYGVKYNQDGPSYDSTVNLGQYIRSGSDTPGWKAIVERGGILPCNNYSLTRNFVKTQLSLGSAFLSGSQTNDKLIRQGYIGWISNFAASDVQYIRAKSLPTSGYQRAYNDAYMKFQKAYDGEMESLAEFMAEANQAIAQLSDIAKSIEAIFRRFCYNILASYKAIQKLAKRNGWKRRRRNRAMHLELVAKWFELHFGLIPLMNDVKSIAEALAEIYGEPHARHKVKGSGKNISTALPEAYSSNKMCAASVGFTIRGTKQFVSHEIVKITALLQPSEMYYDPLLVTGLGWHSIPVGVWEWMPYSWIADYVSNIGDLVQAYTHGQMNVCSPSEIYIQESNVRCLLKADRTSYNVPGITVAGDASIAEQYFKFQRYAWSGSLPALVFDNPLGLSAIRDIHLIMLAIGKLGRETVTEMRIIGNG